VLVEEDVLELEVAVEDAGAVAVLDRPGDREDELHCRPRSEAAFAREALAEGATRRELEDEVELAALDADLVDADDPRVTLDAGQDLGLAAEARAGFGVGEREDLDRAHGSRRHVLGAEDGPGRAAPELAEDGVAAEGERHASCITLP
jgi:hypothetical protein